MKKLLFSCFVLFAFMGSKCEDDTPKNSIDLLPPATQIGANTFGCLVDGEAFIPDRRIGMFQGGFTTKNYIFSNGKYYLAVYGDKRVNGIVESVGFFSEDIYIEEGQTYPLLERGNGNATGGYFPLLDDFYTNSQYTGELKITKHNTVEYIMSGTFWFDVKDSKGVIHEIREGRFDIKY